MRLILPVSLCLILSACGNDNRQAGGVSKAEADGLDAAAARIEQGDEQGRTPIDQSPEQPQAQPSG